MTEHLPECAVAAARPGTFTSCICDELRACEQRVRGEVVQRVEALGWDTSGPKRLHWH